VTEKYKLILRSKLCDSSRKSTQKRCGILLNPSWKWSSGWQLQKDAGVFVLYLPWWPTSNIISNTNKGEI